jgi:hypothetical protein
MPLGPPVEAERAATRPQRARRPVLAAAGALAFVAGTYAGTALWPAERSTRDDVTVSLLALSQSGGPDAAARNDRHAEPVATGSAAPARRDAAQAIYGAPNRVDTIDGKRTAVPRRLDEPAPATAEESEARWYGCRFAAQQIEWAMSHVPDPCMLADASAANSDECRRETSLIESRIKELQMEQRSLRCASSLGVPSP